MAVLAEVDKAVTSLYGWIRPIPAGPAAPRLRGAAGPEPDPYSVRTERLDQTSRLLLLVALIGVILVNHFGVDDVLVVTGGLLGTGLGASGTLGGLRGVECLTDLDL